MNKIVFKHFSSGPASIKIAGNFTKWEIKEMDFNDQEEQWEFDIDQEALRGCPDHNGKAVAYFKFVDGNGVWFTDNNFAKEIDGQGNENNAMYLSFRPENDSSLKAQQKQQQQQEERDRKFEEKEREEEAKLPESPNSTPKVPLATKAPRIETPSLTAQREESPVLINESDFDEQYHETEDQDHKAVVRSELNTPELEASSNNDPKQYKNFLQSMIFFFRSLFYRWFSMDRKPQ
ncbi:LAME_0C08768g1_1 [Lachancea meyersii CBS 8951]|uniref:LAME_0C08768g1_1 n=1 Tax=Lachancea meyersii CBS 8951 TaxID=1266667 RepID=A0A1G4J3D8_9SACH|nr:LAME_0C08768g1_1 [Lachancea meyersii CBS 8951]